MMYTAKLIRKTTQTLRNWDKNGALKPAIVDKHSGYRYYSQEQVDSLLNLRNVEINNPTIGYCRVSSIKQKENLKTYMIAKGYMFDIVEDIGSGINYNKKGLNRLIDLIVSRKTDRIVILYKDRLFRFGFEIIENLCKRFNVTLEIVDNEEKSKEQELVEDLVQIITVFSSKLHGSRANKTKRIVKELIENDTK